MLGTLWSLVWLPMYVALGWPMGWMRFRPFEWDSLAMFGGLGFASGLTFALLLARLERNQTVDRLSARRLLVWGVSAGAGVPIAISAVVLALLPNSHLTSSAYGTFALLGSVGGFTALATLALVRRGREGIGSLSADAGGVDEA